MSSRFAVALSIVSVVFSFGALGLALYRLPAPLQVAEDLPYMLIVVGDHYRQTIGFKSMRNCGEASAYFSAGSAGQLTANCVATK